MSTNYKPFNPNPDTTKHTHGKKRGKVISHSDCVVRAFCKLFNEDWFASYKRLYERGVELFDMPNNEKVWKSFLKQNRNFITMTNTRPRRRLSVSDVANQTAGTRKVYIASCWQHVVAISNGKYYDSWDSGNTPVYSVWELRDDEK